MTASTALGLMAVATGYGGVVSLGCALMMAQDEEWPAAFGLLGSALILGGGTPLLGVLSVQVGVLP